MMTVGSEVELVTRLVTEFPGVTVFAVAFTIEPVILEIVMKIVW